MSSLSFTWDPEKDQLNQNKHDGVSFEEARTVFYDEYARLIHNPVTPRRKTDSFCWASAIG